MKNKILSIVLIFTLLLGTFCTSCFAADSNTTTNANVSTSAKQYTYKSASNSFIIDVDYSNNLFNVTKNKTVYSLNSECFGFKSFAFCAFINENNQFNLSVAFTNGDIILDTANDDCLSSNEGILYHYNFSLDYDHVCNSFTSKGLSLYSTVNGDNGEGVSAGSFKLDKLVYSNVEIKDKDGNVVFQGASQPTRGTLAKVVKAETMKNPLQEILGILPLTLVVVVSCLGLRKALTWLSTLLKQS